MSSDFKTAGEKVATDLSQKLLLLCQNRKERKHQLLQELERKKAELKSKEEHLSTLSDDLKSKKLLVTQLQHSRDTALMNLERCKIETDRLKEVSCAHTARCQILLESFQNKSQRLSHQFKSAPQDFHVDKISDKIETYIQEIEDLTSNIQDEFEPSISTSTCQMKSEPVIFLETPDSLSTELTAKELEYMNYALKGDTEKWKQSSSQLKDDKSKLEKEEAML